MQWHSCNNIISKNDPGLENAGKKLMQKLREEIGQAKTHNAHLKVSKNILLIHSSLYQHVTAYPLFYIIIWLKA